MAIKRCPKCGSDSFLAKKITGVHVNAVENGEFVIKAEGKNYQIEIIGCTNCKAEFDESALVELTPCSKCGKYVSQEELNSNGECDVCQALTQRPELVSMSKEDIIRMMLKLERSNMNNTSLQQPIIKQQTCENNTNPVAEEKVRIARNAIANASNDFAKETSNSFNDAMNAPDDCTNNEPEEKAKRTRKVRKKNDSEVVSTEQVSEEQVNQSANEIVEHQEAPFPNVDQMFKADMTYETPFDDVNLTQTQQDNLSPFSIFEAEQAF